MPAPAPIDPRLRQLRRMKWLALALLGLMLAGFVASHLHDRQGAWAWVAAFCEAGTVGALADWFAVVALFRRPFGLPIPHTAIIPRNRDRIADSLAVFVRDHFLDPELLLARLQALDPAARLGDWLARPEQSAMLAELARNGARQALDLLDEAAVRRNIQAFVLERLRQWNAAATAGDVLGLLTADGRHQRLLDEALKRLARWLDDAEVKERVSAMLVRYARREWPKLVGTVNWVKPVDGIADTLADRIAHALMDELDQVLSEPQHPLRQDYAQWLSHYIARLHEDPQVIARVEAIKQRLIDQPSVQDYVQGLWEQIRAALREDLARADGVLARQLTQSLAALGRSLQRDPALRAALDQHLLAGAARLTTRLREGVTEHISRTVKSWDAHRLSNELELGVGRDLQYIRYNGTLVGGLIGLALHAIGHWL